jgi:hypothetical protein
VVTSRSYRAVQANEGQLFQIWEKGRHIWRTTAADEVKQLHCTTLKQPVPPNFKHKGAVLAFSNTNEKMHVALEK